jgi:hypothetical protein
LEFIKRIRNAIAHRNDRAWASFTRLCKDPPFSLTSPQMKGITPGRVLVAHSWNGQSILREAILVLESAAKHLVP